MSGEPRIVGFLCHWCSYAGADMAGTSRMKQPASVRIVRFPCTGRINPLIPLRALLDGADGVLISGCHPGDCHYREGNLYARRRFELLQRFIPYMGIDSARLRYVWVSASEGQRWQEIVTDFTNKLKEMGYPKPKQVE
ncbi:MAG: hydrogenase iron-sulfur subunit [Candidatus Schekmanbacteria bacterium]|nr:hydrogenase iron-sulfur subunit [Candidatus Schekmanbacteria bacterium]